ncbi:hypothetical protein bcgnr5371_60780 [Bacillus cereus]
MTAVSAGFSRMPRRMRAAESTLGRRAGAGNAACRGHIRNATFSEPVFQAVSGETVAASGMRESRIQKEKY